MSDALPGPAMEYAELRDRCWVAADSWESYVVDHDVVKSHPELQAATQKATTALYEVYAMLGQIDPTLNDKESTS